LPGKIDGPVAGGIATHGRFEGKVASLFTVGQPLTTAKVMSP